MEPYLCVFLVLLLPLFTYEKAAGDCPPDFLTLLGNCYKMLPGTYKGVDAVSECRSLGANITSSKAEAENQLLLDLRSNASRGGQRLWLGMTDSASPNEWRWTDDNTLVDAYPTSHHWRQTTKSETSTTNNLQCAWITADNKGRVWSHTKCNNHAAVTVCKIYLNEISESATDKTTSMNNELSSVQNMMPTDMTTTTDSASSSDQYIRLSNHVRTTSTLLSTFIDTAVKQSLLSVDEDNILIDKTTATMTTSPTATMQPHIAATSAITFMALPSSSAPHVTVDKLTPSPPAHLETDNSTVPLPTTSTELFLHTSLQTQIDTTDNYDSYLFSQPSFTETPFTATTKYMSTNVSPITAPRFTLVSQFLYPSMVNNVIPHTTSHNCLCPCKTKLLPDVLLSLQEKYASLILKTSTLSSYVRKKISIADFRVSSNYIGVSGLIVCIVPVFLVIGSDVLTCVKGK
ncbi:mucin-4-like [Haliotis asinina]|uniref:mucin-4-like n=1 Tax=Haliotis asinina TaxID=109174 RepID=UPI0035324F6A